MATPTSHRGPDGYWTWDQPCRSATKGGSGIIYSHISDTTRSLLNPSRDQWRLFRRREPTQTGSDRAGCRQRTGHTAG